MSSGGKGGAASQSKMVYGSGVIALSWGPWDWLSAVIHNGNYLFDGDLTLSTDVTDLTGAIADPSYLAPGGSLKLYRGTETQPADFTGRRNKGTVTLECRGVLFGQDTGTAPNLQVIGGGLPRVPTAIVAATDNVADDGQVNPVACWAELLLDERGGNIPQAVFDADSWLAAAHWAWENRTYTFISPLITDQVALRSLARRLLDPFHGYCRWTAAGKLACNVYEWGVDPGGLPILDARHFNRRPKIPLGDWDDVKTEMVVSYTDRDYQFQRNTVIVPNAVAAQIRQVDDQGKLDRPDVMRRPQAQQHGVEYNRRLGTAPSRATLPLRRPVLDALALGIGDKVKIDTDPEPGGAGLAQLCRIEGIRRGQGDVADLTVVTDNLVPATVYTPEYATPGEPFAESPPIEHCLGVPLPPSVWGLPRTIAMLVTRPVAATTHVSLFFADEVDGDYDELGFQTGFAVRAELAGAIAAGAGTLQLEELDGLDGPDAELAANTPGGNPTAAANNTLLALLCTLDGNGRIAIGSNGDPVMEFVSIQERALVSGATHEYTVLRGRLGTTAQAWGAGAVAWIIPRENLVAWNHELFDSLAAAPAFFRLVSATADAVDETIPVPSCSINMLSGVAPMVLAATGNDALTAIPVPFAPGYVGGTADLVFRLNQDGSGANPGEILVTGSTFYHPDGTTRFPQASAVINTALGEGIHGRAFIMWTDTAPATRFGGGSWGTSLNLIVVVPGSGDWIALDNAATTFHFTPLATDCLIAAVGAESVSSGLTRIVPMIGGAVGPAGDDGADGAPGAPGEDGIDGTDGAYVSFVFKNAATAPAAPTGGSYDGTDEVIPAGWTDDPSTPPAGQFTFVSRRRYYPSGGGWTGTPWTTPGQFSGDDGATGAPGAPGEDGVDGNDGAYVSFVFKNAASAPTAPTGGSYDGTNETIPSGWTDNPSTPPAGQFTFVSRRRYYPSGGGWTGTAWTTPGQFSGDDGATGAPGAPGVDGVDGDDGAYVSFVFKNAATAPAAPTGGSYDGTSETIPSGWTDNPSTPTAGEFTFVSRRRYYPSGGGWTGTAWTTPGRFSGEQGPAGADGSDATPGQASASGGGTVSSTTYTAIGGTPINTGSFTRDGQQRSARFSGYMTNATGGTMTCGVAIYRSGVMLVEYTQSLAAGQQVPVPIESVDTVSGSYTYEIRAKSSTGGSLAVGGTLVVQ